MTMMFANCLRCKRDREVFPQIQICNECYQKEKYWERRVKAAASDPAELAKAGSIILKGYKIFKDSGIITPLRYSALSEEVMGWMTDGNRVSMQNEEVQIENSVIEERLDGIFTRKVVYAESVEEAKAKLEAAQKPRLPEAVDSEKTA